MPPVENVGSSVIHDSEREKDKERVKRREETGGERYYTAHWLSEGSKSPSWELV